VIALDRQEVTLLREQIRPVIHALDPVSPTGHFPSRAPGTSLVFPTKTGQPWRHWQWLRFVWYPARARAADAWRLERELELDAPTPFDDRKPHDLRATAITLMLDHGMTPGAVATRVGHADGGALIAARYDRDPARRTERARRELEARAGAGLRAGGSR
jgi:integrase